MTVATNQTATVALTKQEILRNALVAAPIDSKYGTAENRIAIVELVGTLYNATYNDVIIASIKRPEDLANLLIDKKHTSKAQWANVAELNFLCDVPADTPNKGGMKKAGGKLAAFQAKIQAVIPAERNKMNKDELIKVFEKIALILVAEG